MKEELRGDFKLYVKAGYTNKGNVYKDSELHAQGRAFDLTLISSKTEKIVTAVHTLSWLGEVAYKGAGFSYVRFNKEANKNTIHVSCTCQGG